MILVTGATGKVGTQAVKALLARKEKVRVLARDPAKARTALGKDVEVVEGDLGRPWQLDAAMKGVDKVFLLTSGGLDQAWLAHNIIESAKKAGVKHVVKMSAIGSAPDAMVQLGRQHAAVEAELKASGLAWTILQPNFFMQNVLVSADSIKKDGAFYGPYGTAKAAVIDAVDIGEVAAVALTQAGHAGKTYVLTGGEALSQADIAERVGKALGRTVKYVEVPPDAARASMIGGGMSGSFADDMVALGYVWAQGWASAVTPDTQNVLGRAPRTYADFLKDNLAALK